MFDRLLRPRSVAVVGGGAWCANVIGALRGFGFDGPIYPVHPTRGEVGGVAAWASVAALPEAPDAAFVGINRAAAVVAMRALAARGAGGAVCFASGFGEAAAELSDGASLQQELVSAVGDMPVLGPNCYGFVNALDGVALWPDVHGLVPVARGVAVLSQSSNVALNLTMQARGLPLGFVGCLGNQAKVDMSALGLALLEDARVTALGLFMEGIADLRGFEALAARARALGKGIVVLKLGASAAARAAAVSHTASLTGSDAGARAFLARIGVAQVGALSAMLECLKILHVVGPLASNRIASMSCSGGEASLMADAAVQADVVFPPLTAAQEAGLRAALGGKVALANPLDYHTYIWGDPAAMAACFGAMMAGDLALGIVVLDFPRLDRCDVSAWMPTLEAVAAARASCGTPMAVLASLVETMPEEMAAACLARGLVPLSDLPAALEAIAAAARCGRAAVAAPVLLPEAAPGASVGFGYFGQEETQGGVLGEDASKAALARAGVPVPARHLAQTAAAAGAAAVEIGFPVVVKGIGLAHKSEAAAVRLDLADRAAVEAAARDIGGPVLVEEMVGGAVAELLVGVTRDPAHGFVLTLGAGGVLTEVMRDTVTLLLPVTGEDLRAALGRLRLAPVLAGYRGRAGADGAALVDAVLAVQTLVEAEAHRIEEVEINPLICKETGVIAVDALIRLKEGG